MGRKQCMGDGAGIVEKAGTTVGKGRVIVTPPGPVAMSGFAARTSRSAGVADELEARATAFAGYAGEAPALLVALDAIGVDSGFTAALRRRLTDRISGERVAVIATHTHGGPALLDGAELGVVDAATRERYLAGAEAAARQALQEFVPAELRFGSATVSGVARNRRDPSGPVDDELTVLWAEGEGGEVVTILVSFALHPVVLGPDNVLLTRDYVGYVLDALEREFPGTMAVFATGCAGQVNHGHGASASFRVGPDPARTFAVARAIGERLAEAAARVVRLGGAGAGTRAPAVARRVLSLPLATGQGSGRVTADVVRELTEALGVASRSGNAPAVALLEPQLRWARRGWEAVPAVRDTELMAFGLGGVALVFLPGEPFVEYGLDLKSRVASGYAGNDDRVRGARGRMAEMVMPIGYANDAPGYLPTAAAVTEGGYEVELAYRFYGLPARYAARVETEVGRAASALLRRVVM